MNFLNDPIWFPPQNVIHHFNQIQLRLSPTERSSKRFRKAEEAFHVAVMLIGIQKATGVDYWIQLVGDEEGSPDVRTAEKKGFLLSVQDVEVVEYRENAEESLVNFIVRTKISQRAYDSLTTILCRIDKTIHIPSVEQLQKDLQPFNVATPIYILGKTSPSNETYMIAKINPEVNPGFHFDLIAEVTSAPHRRVLRLEKGTVLKNEEHPEEKHYPFDKLNLCCHE